MQERAFEPGQEGRGRTQAGGTQPERAAEAGLDKLGVASACIPRTHSESVPHAGTAQGGQRLDPRLAPLAAIDQALERFKTMKIVTVDPAIAHTNGFTELGPKRQVNRRQSPCDRKRRSRHERKPIVRAVSTMLFGPVPVPRQMLVVKNWHRPPAAFENVDRLLKELITRIERLPLFIARILAVLADQQHAIDGELVAATGQGRGDRGINLHSRMSCRSFATQIVRGPEIDIERHNIHRGSIMLALPAVPVEEAIDDPLRMGNVPVFRDDRGDPRASAGLGSASLAFTALSATGIAALASRSRRVSAIPDDMSGRRAMLDPPDDQQVFDLCLTDGSVTADRGQVKIGGMKFGNSNARAEIDQAIACILSH